MNCNYIHPHSYLSPVGWEKMNKKLPLLLIEFMNISLGFFAQFRFHEYGASPHTCSWNISVTSFKFTIICTGIIYLSWFSHWCVLSSLAAHIPCVTWRLNLIGKISYLFWAIAAPLSPSLSPRALCLHAKNVDCLLNKNIHFRPHSKSQKNGGWSCFVRSFIQISLSIEIFYLHVKLSGPDVLRIYPMASIN